MEQENNKEGGLKIKLRLGGEVIQRVDSQPPPHEDAKEKERVTIRLGKRAIEDAASIPSLGVANGGHAMDIATSPASSFDGADARTKPLKKRRKSSSSSSSSSAAAATARPKARSKARGGGGSDGDDDDGEYVGHVVGAGKGQAEEEANHAEERGSSGGADAEASSGPKVRRSSRRRAEQNKYVIYDNLNDDDYLHKIEKEAHAGRLDFVATILEHRFEDPSAIMDVYETGEGMSYGTLFKKLGFKRPILFKDARGLEMKLPSSETFDVDSVAALVGNRELDVIDVMDQSELRPPWKMEDWVQYFNQPPEARKRILNVISLEFSGTKLAHKVRAPKFVRKADWVDIVWPKELKERALKPPETTNATASIKQERPAVDPAIPSATPSTTEKSVTQSDGAEASVEEAESKEKPGEEKNTLELALAGLEQLGNAASAVKPEPTSTPTPAPAPTPAPGAVADSRAYYPKVQHYCLMSVKGSYTDFHIDFGGSSVWYHVLSGKKVFFMIAPTQENLKRYEKWVTSPSQGNIFLASKVDHCYKIELNPGNTMLIPTGWIHAVYTPEDSLVFGGNFLHAFNIPMQLQCYQIEERTRTEGKFRFPLFEMMQWYAAQNYLKKLQDKNRSISEFERTGLLELVERLSLWFNHPIDAERLQHQAQVPIEVSDPETMLQELKAVLEARRPRFENEDHAPIKIIIKKSALPPELISSTSTSASSTSTLTSAPNATDAASSQAPSGDASKPLTIKISHAAAAAALADASQEQSLSDEGSSKRQLPAAQHKLAQPQKRARRIVDASDDYDVIDDADAIADEGSDNDEFSLSKKPKPKTAKAATPKKAPKKPATKAAKATKPKKETKAPLKPAQEAERRASLSLSGVTAKKSAAATTARARLTKKIARGGKRK